MNDRSDPWSVRRRPETSPVPPRYHGVWSRTLLETPVTRDDTSFVRWMQLGRWHADLRIPANRPAGPAPVAIQQGFAGLTEVTVGREGEVCCWHRLVDCQPPGPHPDAGLMVFESPDCVIETGIHGVYREVWRRLPGSSAPLIALAEAGRDDGKSGAHVFIAGQYLMRVRPQLIPGPDFEISFGSVDQATGCWTIEHSTLPDLEKQTLVFSVQRTDHGSARLQLGGEDDLWTVLEWVDP